jgi:hypothetical protein
MSEHSHDYLVSSSLAFGRREFVIKVGHDGISFWTDKMEGRKAIDKKPARSISEIFDPIRFATNSRIYDEYTYQAPVPEADLKRIRDELSPRYWNEETLPYDFDLDRQLDAIFEPIFWGQINPQLSRPCVRPPKS